MELGHRRLAADVILHHVRGGQYTSARYRAKAEAAHMVLSMSRPGMPYDNAMAESFFSTLKLELVPDKAFASREAARLAVFDSIETSYTRTRMPSALGYQSPVNSKTTSNPLRKFP